MPLKAISRRLANVQTLSGSHSHHQFLDIGVPGRILWRERSCHICPGCMKCDPELIRTACQFNERCGQAEYVNLEVLGKSSTVLTRSRAASRALQLSQAAAVGDFLAIETEGSDLPWTLGQVVACVEEHTGEDEKAVGRSGMITAGDRVVQLRRWMPLENGGGSSTQHVHVDGRCRAGQGVRRALLVQPAEGR